MAESKGNSKHKEDISLKTFASETSAHGIRNVCSSNRYIIIRLVWFFGFVGAVVLLGITLYSVAVEYYKYPFLTATHTVPRHELEFPAVTICNINSYDTSHYEYGEQLNEIMIKFTVPGFSRQFNLSDFPYSKILNTSIKELTDNLSPTDLLLLCIWEDVTYFDCSEIFKPIYTLVGRCYQFNGNMSSRLKIKRIGSVSGLRVVFHINQSNGVVTSDYSAGLKIHLHEPHELPDLLSEGFTVSTGHSTKVAMTQNKFHFLPHPYKAFGDEACEETLSPDFPVKVNYSEIYSSSACLTECVSEKALNECNCKHLTQTEADEPYCTFLEGSLCFLPNWYKLYVEARTNGTCDCPLPCSSVHYQTRMSTSSFPSVATGKMLINAGMIKSIEQGRNDYGEFRIYYEDLMLHETRHEPQYTLTSIMATVGGQMGFFLGASLLTLAEFVEFIIVLFGMLFRWTLLRFSGAGQMKSKQNIVQVKPIE